MENDSSEKGRGRVSSDSEPFLVLLSVSSDVLLLRLMEAGETPMPRGLNQLYGGRF